MNDQKRTGRWFLDMTEATPELSAGATDGGHVGEDAGGGREGCIGVEGDVTAEPEGVEGKEEEE